MGPGFVRAQEELPSLFDLGVSPGRAAVVVLPVPWEVSTSFRQGTAEAPLAVLRASVQVDLYDPWLGSPEVHGMAMLPVPEQVPRWNAQAREALAREDTATVDCLAASRNALVEQLTGELLAQDKCPVILGGEHGASLGAIRAAAGREPLGLLQVDAHADLRPQYQGLESSHASFAARALELPGVIRLVQVGVRDLCRQEAQRAADDPRICTFYDARRPAWRLEQVIDALPKRVWISWDIDGLQPALCPNTGTPVPGGLSWPEALTLLRLLVESGRVIVGCDLCEVVPEGGKRPPGQGWDEIVAAQLLYRLCGWMLVSRGIHRPDPLPAEESAPDADSETGT